jgi:hypothetical protein
MAVTSHTSENDGFAPPACHPNGLTGRGFSARPSSVCRRSTGATDGYLLTALRSNLLRN